jgi:cytochrome bd ubiquinol oxidase subunit II
LFAYAVVVDLKVMISWVERPYLLLVPGAGIAAAFLLAVTTRHERDDVPFYAASTVFVTAFLTLAISFWPYMVPFAIRIEDPAAPASSLAFMFWAGVFVFPLTLLYTVINYIVFRGRVKPSAGHY